MPSKSAKQHRLMAAVANNPAFAKKVGISQSVGQEFMKADKRKAKKFQLGGPTEYAESGSAGGTNSFKDAFRAARKAGQDTFTWQGKKYTTEMAGASKPAASKVEVQKTETKVEMPAAPRGRGGAGEKPSKSIAEQLDTRPGSGAGFRNLMANLGTSSQRARMKAMGYGDDEEDSDESPAMKRIRLAREVAESSRGPGRRYTPVQGMSTAERRMYEAGRGMKRGGDVKKYKSGGAVSSVSKRADGIASKGKTRCKIV
jgi:hypothetical protein